MDSFLFPWNPDDYPELIRDYNDWLKGKLKPLSWSSGLFKSIPSGARAFVMRVGVEPKGIIASGRTASGWYEKPHFSEPHKKENANDLEFDKFSHPDHPPVLLKELLQIKDKTAGLWLPQSTAKIPDDVADKLEIAWANALNTEGVASNRTTSETRFFTPKLIVLKPIMWNDNGYQRPAGCKSTSGYSHENGFGHEEWNNNSRWFWQGWKVFHTEANQRLRDAAKDGNLGMLMIASRRGTPYALGVATNVYANSKEDMPRIARTVGQDKDWPAVWELATVRAHFPDQDDFVRQRLQRPHIEWRCLPSNYYWFPSPIPLDSNRLTGKKRLAMHHGRFTEITPAALLDIIDAHMPANRLAMRQWLSTGDFSQTINANNKGQKHGERILRRLRHGGNAPTDRRFEYWVTGNRTVEPLHDRLQKLFVAHLKAQDIKPEENVGYIDVRYTRDGVTTLCEIKPTDNVETRYAIRAAIGQLLEYRFKNKPITMRMEIVIGSKPQDWEVEFVKSLGIGLTYFDTKEERFIRT